MSTSGTVFLERNGQFVGVARERIAMKTYQAGKFNKVPSKYALQVLGVNTLMLVLGFWVISKIFVLPRDVAADDVRSG